MSTDLLPEVKPPGTRGRARPWPALAAGAIAFLVYAMTAARTITFWEGAHYSLLARTLSISNPPGSLLLTLIGWMLGAVPFAEPVAFRLNLIAALIGALTAGMIAHLGERIVPDPETQPWPTALAAIAGGLGFAFAITPWTYSTQFNPYMLSALFTTLILWAFVRWWERAENDSAPAAAALVALLVGLDLSVHRGNLVLVPALAAGVLLRRPRAFLDRRWLGFTAGALVLGLAFQLLYIPIARREPFLDITAPTTLVRLWHYVSLERIGGGFLLDVWPRHADFVTVQLADLGRFLRANLGGFFGWTVALALVAVGLVVLFRRSWRLATAMLVIALFASFGIVAYFNRPESYFRSLDRNYLVALVAWMPLICAGLVVLAHDTSARVHRFGGLAIGVLALALPAYLAMTNLRASDRSRTRFAERFGRDLIEPLAPGALIITNGDNDTFPSWYLQQVEGVRRDVLVVNAGVAWTPPGLKRLKRADPGFATLAATDSIAGDIVRLGIGHRPVYLAVTLAGMAGLPYDRLRIEGLSYRVLPDSGGGGPDVPALQSFLRERLARAGFDDPRQILEPDLLPLGANYAAATFQLLNAQLGAGDSAAARSTLEALERHYPESRWPQGWDWFHAQLAQARQATGQATP